MQKKTSSEEFYPFGQIDSHWEGADQWKDRSWQIHPRRSISSLFCFESPICLELQEGMALLLAGERPSPEALKEFAMHRRIRLHAGVYFDVAAITPTAVYRMWAPPPFAYKIHTLERPYLLSPIHPIFQVVGIQGYYYNLRKPGYRFAGEAHGYYELTFVDRGVLHSDIEGQPFTLRENQILLYGPGQYHTQNVGEEGSCSYLTVIFSVRWGGKKFSHGGSCPDLEPLLGRVFGFQKEIHSLVKEFVKESNSSLPFAGPMMLATLQKILLLLLQYDAAPRPAHDAPYSQPRQQYQNQLLENILTHIDTHIHQPITIAELCRRFSLSRSSLQLLFKEGLGQTPKKYISDLKLEHSKTLIREGRYTISEIALMLGFNSIHYFSRIFTAKYKIAPSEYAKQLLVL